MSEGFFLGLQTDYELMESRRRMKDTLRRIRPLSPKRQNLVTAHESRPDAGVLGRHRRLLG